MANRKMKIPPPPPESAPDKVKAAYYEKYDPIDLIDAGYLEEDGLFSDDTRITDLRPERGLVTIPIEEHVARKLYRLARRSKSSVSELATRLLARDLENKSRAG